jgi:hypothetical protein
MRSSGLCSTKFVDVIEKFVDAMAFFNQYYRPDFSRQDGAPLLKPGKSLSMLVDGNSNK